MFNHKNLPSFELPTLELLDDREGHWYRSESGEIFPSITTMLGSIDGKPWYKFWIQKIMRDHGVSDWEAEYIAKDIGDSSMAVGTRMHKFAEDYLNNKTIEVENLDEYETSPFNLFIKIKKYLDDHINDIYLVEKKMFSKDLGLAGTTDFIAHVDGVLSIGDFKNFRKRKYPSNVKKYFVQGTAYAIMFEELTGIHIPQVVIIGAVWNGEVQIFKANTDDYRDILYSNIEKFKTKQ